MIAIDATPFKDKNVIGAGFRTDKSGATSANFTGIARSFSNSPAPARTVKFHSVAVARSAQMMAGAGSASSLTALCDGGHERG